MSVPEPRTDILGGSLEMENVCQPKPDVTGQCRPLRLAPDSAVDYVALRPEGLEGIKNQPPIS